MGASSKEEVGVDAWGIISILTKYQASHYN